MDLRTKVKTNRYAIWILLLIFGLFQYGIQKICCFTIYPDEFGYWASAAKLAGYDWSETASLGSYYSFGYSLLLFPILYCFAGGTAAYRAALFLNMLLVCAGLFLMERILEKLFPDIGREIGFLLGGTAVLYPAWMFYMQMTMAESVLFFVFLLDVYLFLRFMEEQKTRFAVMLALFLAYGYCLHMRTAATVLACVLALALWCALGTGRKRGLAAGVLLLLAAGVLALRLKERTIADIFAQAEAEMLAVNDYSGQIGKLATILTKDGLLRLLVNIVGKLYYLGLASFGTFYWGLAWCLRECAALVRNRRGGEGTTPAQWMALFLLLAVAGQVAVSAVFTYGTTMIDGLVYGRYNELLVPVMMAAGIVAMMRSRHPFRFTALIGAALGGGTLLLIHEAERRNMSGIRGCHIAGISYLLRGEDMGVRAFLLGTWLLGMGLTALVCLCVWLCRRHEHTRWLLCGILAIEVAAGIQISHHYTYAVNTMLYQNRVIAEKIEERAGAETEIWYLEEGKQALAGFLQMQLPDRTIHVIRPEELARIDASQDMVITSVMTEQGGRLEEVFDRNLAASLFHLYYH